MPGRPFATALALFSALLFVLAPVARADRIGTPYRGPAELASGGQSDASGGDSGGGGGGDSGGGGGDSGGGGGDSGGGGGDSGGGGGDSGGGGGDSGGGAGGGGGAGAGGKKVALDGYRVWQWYWEHNKDRYLARATQRGRVYRGSSYYWFGSGAKYPPRELTVVSTALREGKVFAAIERALQDSDLRVRAEACIAMGRLGSKPVPEAARKPDLPDDFVARALAHVLATLPGVTPDQKAVRISAILGLGISGTDAAGAVLLQHLDRAPAEEKTYTLLALGVARYAPALPKIAALVPSGGSSFSDPQIAAVHALGLYGPEFAAVIAEQGAVDRVRRLADTRHDTMASQAVTALGRLQQRFDDVRDAFQRSKSKNVQWSAVLAMANYAQDEKDAEKAAKALITDCFKAGEGQTKNFSLLAAGDLASRLDPNSKVRERLVDHLRKVLENKDNYLRSCAAVALGFARDVASEPAIVKVLEDPASNHVAVSGAALALGLLRATNQAEKLRMEVLLKTQHHPDSRGYAALALALMGDTTRVDDLVALHAKNLNDIQIARQTALALGVLGDRDEVKTIAENFAAGWKSQDQHRVSNAAFAFAWMRDETAVDRLVELLKSPDANVRGMAVIALGYTAARDPVNPLSRCYENASHRGRFLWEPLHVISQIL
jgi:HEAT repeat protein